MAFHPRMTRPGLRIALEALEAYLPQLHDDAHKIAEDLIRELHYQLNSANTDNRRRAADRQDCDSTRTNGGTCTD